METTFDPENTTGLSEEKAAGILKTEGYNELPSQKKQSLFSILLNVLKEPMLLLLLVAGLIYLFLGEVKDALILLVFVFVVVGITFNQQRKTERALDALKNLSSPRALVIRDGEQKRIPGREVVKGDILILREETVSPQMVSYFFVQIFWWTNLCSQVNRWQLENPNLPA